MDTQELARSMQVLTRRLILAAGMPLLGYGLTVTMPDSLLVSILAVLAYLVGVASGWGYYIRLGKLANLLGRSWIAWVGLSLLTAPIGPLVAYVLMRNLVRDVIAGSLKPGTVEEGRGEGARQAPTADVGSGSEESVPAEASAGPCPRKEEWIALCTRLSHALEEIREEWFRACVAHLRQSSRLKRVALVGDGGRAAKAFQLHLVSNYLAQHEYIRRSEGRDFADILFAQVCGSELRQCLPFVRRYYDTGRGGALFRFGADIACYLTGNDNPLQESMAVANLSVPFGILTHVAVAGAFGDQRTVSALQAELATQCQR